MSYQDFMDWKANPVTKQVFLEISKRRDELKDRVVAEAAAQSPQAHTVAGAVQALDFILNLDYEDSNDN